MSAPIMHIAAGMSIPFLACLPCYLKLTSKKLLIVVSLMIVCGAWAEIPDAPRYFMSHEEFGQLHYAKSFKPLSRYSPEINAFLKTISYHAPFLNVFAFHEFLDTHQSEAGGFREGGGAISFMFLTLLFAARAALLRNEKEIGALKKARLSR